jgi:hypothetical protein
MRWRERERERERLNQIPIWRRVGSRVLLLGQNLGGDDARVGQCRVTLQSELLDAGCVMRTEPLTS